MFAGLNIGNRFILLVCVSLIPNIALAYLGPGAGFTALLAGVGIVLALIALILSYAMLPLKRLHKILFRKQSPEQKSLEKTDESESDEVADVKQNGN